MNRRVGMGSGVLLAAVLAACGGAPAAPAGPLGTDAQPSRTPTVGTSRSPATTPPVATASPDPSTHARLREDLASLQSIADEHGGVRAVGTSGYEASVEWAAAAARDAGMAVTTPEVTFTGFRDLGASLEVGERTFAGPDEVRALIYSASGRVRAPVVVLEASGCAAADFAAVPAGAIALTTQGGCFRREQALNAVAADAAALVVGYPGRGPGEIYRPTLLEPAGIDIPVVSVTDEAVGRIVANGSAPVTLAVETERAPTTFRNVIGQLGDGPRFVMVGAHLDSVLDGPGINDNGSGVAAALEVARRLAADGLPAGWGVRIGLWGAEELGTYGSRDYAAAAAEDIAAYLNLDMTGSINGATLIYDEPGAAPGSDQITRRYEEWFSSRELPSSSADLGGGSDHFGFTQAGVPTGGLFAGASESGGAASPGVPSGGPAPDPCYHIACDTLDNVDVDRVALFAEATAAVVRELMQP